MNKKKGGGGRVSGDSVAIPSFKILMLDVYMLKYLGLPLQS